MDDTQPEIAPVSVPPRDGQHVRPKRRRRRRGVAAVVAVIVIIAAGGGLYVYTDPFNHKAAATTINNNSKTSLGKVTKGDLSSRSMQNGTLGYAGSYQLVNRSSG